MGTKVAGKKRAKSPAVTSSAAKSKPVEMPPRVECFPRTEELSVHSPIFWAENKDRFLRQLLIRDIERLGKRRLCVYFSSPFLNVEVNSADVGRLYEIVSADRGEPFDLLLETAGGETDATEGLVSMLRGINRDFRVIVPSRAKSNGTMICLAAREIVMGLTSELGPVEPTLERRPVSVLMTKEYKENSFPLYSAARDAYNQTKKLAHKLLSDGMMKGHSEKRRDELIRKLCTRDHFHSHGSVIDWSEAQSLGLEVRFLQPEDELWKRYWLLHQMYLFDSSLRNVGKFFEGQTLSRQIVQDGKMGVNHDPKEND
jgi:hypothetical protein